MLGKTLIFVILLSSILIAQSNFQPLNLTKSNAIIFNENYSMSKNYSLRDNTITRKHSILNLTGQAIAGPVFSAVFSFLPLAATVSSAFNSKSVLFVPAYILTIASYLFGNAVGVHWMAKMENKDLSFWGTVGYSAIGGLGSIAVLGIYSSVETSVSPPVSIIALLCPLISSMIYTSFIAEWPTTNQAPVALNKYLSHKDVYEGGKLFNIELFRVGL